MTEDAEENTEGAQVSRKRKPLPVAVLCAALGGGLGYITVAEGFLPIPGLWTAQGVAEDADQAKTTSEVKNIAFVPLDPILVSIDANGATRHLRFQAQLEVAPQFATEVTQLTPRIVDVLNTYLRAVDLADIADKGEFSKMRSHMLRRVRIVAGEGRVTDLLIMELVVT